MQLSLKLRLSSLRLCLSISYRPFGFIVPKYFLIIWLYNLSILNVPDEGDSRNTSRALNLISTFVFVTRIVLILILRTIYFCIGNRFLIHGRSYLT